MVFDRVKYSHDYHIKNIEIIHARHSANHYENKEINNTRCLANRYKRREILNLQGMANYYEKELNKKRREKRHEKKLLVNLNDYLYGIDESHNPRSIS